MLKLHLVNKEDADLAKYIVDAFKLKGSFVNRRPRRGYSYVYQIEYPLDAVEWTIGRYLATYDIDPGMFAKPNRAEAAIKKGKKLLKDSQMQESLEADTIRQLKNFCEFFWGDANKYSYRLYDNTAIMSDNGNNYTVKIKVSPKGKIIYEETDEWSGYSDSYTFASWNEFLDWLQQDKAMNLNLLTPYYI